MTPFALKKVKREMKALLVMALSSLCATAALADEAPTELAGQNAPIVEDYTYILTAPESAVMFQNAA